MCSVLACIYIVTLSDALLWRLGPPAVVPKKRAEELRLDQFVSNYTSEVIPVTLP
jgi:hypothetical protein